MSTSSILSAVLSKTINEQLDINVNRALDHRDFINRQMLNKENPIEVKSSSWQSIDHNGIDVLNRAYTFGGRDHLMYFINEVLNESFRIGHDPIMTIDHDTIDVILYTKDVNDITDADINMSKIIDEIYHDIDYLEGL